MNKLYLILTIFVLIASCSAIFAVSSEPTLIANKSVFPTDINQGSIATITFDLNAFGSTMVRQNLDVMLTLDKSVSMNGTKLTSAIDAAKIFIDQLDFNYDRVGLISYSKSINLDSNLTNDFNSVKTKVTNIKVSKINGTNTGDAITKSNSQLIISNNIKIEILLSDGLPTSPYCGDTVSCYKDVNYAINAAIDAKAKGIIIYTISLGSDANIEFMKQIANITGGKEYYSPSASDLQNIFLNIADDVNNLVASNINIIDVLPIGVEPINLPSSCSYNLETKTVSCTAGLMNNNENKSIDFNVMVNDYNLKQINVSSQINYTNYTGTDSKYVIEIQPQVNVIDLAPIAKDDSVQIDEDTNAIINALANDSDPGNDILNVIEITQPTNGIATINDDGTITYTPKPNFFGNDSFNYTISDGSLTATAKIDINVLPINDSPILSEINDLNIDQNTIIDFNITATDIDSNILSFSTIGLPSWLLLTDNYNGTANIYGMAEEIGDYNINFIVNDDQNAFDSKQVLIQVIQLQDNNDINTIIPDTNNIDINNDTNTNTNPDTNSTPDTNTIITPPHGGSGSGGSGGSSCTQQITYGDWSTCVAGKETRTYTIVKQCGQLNLEPLEKTCEPITNETTPKIKTENPKPEVKQIIKENPIQEEPNIDTNQNTNTDVNTNKLTTPTGLFTLGNSTLPGIIMLVLMIIGYAGYKVYGLRKKELI